MIDRGMGYQILLHSNVTTRYYLRGFHGLTSFLYARVMIHRRVFADADGDGFVSLLIFFSLPRLLLSYHAVIFRQLLCFAA